MLSFPKLISSFPGANPLPPEHKIEVFVRFWGLEPPFSGFSSTNSAFLCAFGLRDRRFRAFRAQIRGFCAFLAFGTRLFGHFEHKIEVFVRFWGLEPPFSEFSSTKSGFLCSRGGESGIGNRNSGDAYHFAVAPAHPHTGTSNGPQQWHPHSNGTRSRCCAVWCRLCAVMEWH